MIRLGIIGCGAVTELHHLPALKRVAEIRVVALADIDPARLQRLGSEYAIRDRHSTALELIQASSIDAVAVCLPPQLHAAVALDALDHGKHVFIEKPLALTLADCDRLIEASNHRPAQKVMVGFNLRWHRLVRRARDIINRDELGRIASVRTEFAGKKGKAADGDSVIFDLGVHHFDIVRFLLGTELAVISSTRDSSDAATVTLSATSGAQVVSSFARGTAENQTIEICGERGSLRLSCYRTDGLERFRANEQRGAVAARLRKATNTFVSLPRAVSQRSTGGEYAQSYVEEWKHFAEAILRDRPAHADLLAGTRAVEIALAASNAK
jgi:myo-inositol 2-dehydrogenase / D-chiro-inositol 1-dehydrogenase